MTYVFLSDIFRMFIRAADAESSVHIAVNRVSLKAYIHLH